MLEIPIPRFAICNETYGDWPLEQALADIANAGYEGVEIAPFTLADDPRLLDENQARAIGDQIRSHGLTVVGLHWLLASPEGMHWTSPSIEVRATTTEFVKHLVKLCAAMGGNMMVWGSPQQRSYDASEPYAEVMDRAVEVISEVCDCAGRAGVTIAVEPLGPLETNFLTTAAETVELIERVNHPACRLHLDVKAMASERTPIEQVIHENAKYTAHFHANDPNLRGPGQGEVNFSSVAQALTETGYDQWVSVEVFDYTPDAPTIARESMAALQKSFNLPKEEQIK